MRSALLRMWNAFKLPFTHNRCDSCGFTEEEVYVTEFFTEGGYLQCKSCIDKEKINQLN